jgi:hypothetical protein
MIEPRWELAQLEAYGHALETKVEELKAEAAKAGAKDMAEFVRQIAALRAKQEVAWNKLQSKMGEPANSSRGWYRGTGAN